MELPSWTAILPAIVTCEARIVLAVVEACRLRIRVRWKTHRILTVSKPWVTVTAPQAATPPAMKALCRVGQLYLAFQVRKHGARRTTYPIVVDIEKERI